MEVHEYKKPYLTVCTPTYNRGYILRRPFESLMKQTFKEFEWLVIDDGSTDGTEELVRQFKAEADFNIRYVKKENGGRASALNLSYEYISTEYVCNLDSDDELFPYALEKMHDAWESMSAQEKKRFWCVVGHCWNVSLGRQIGPMWPEGINSLMGRAQYKVINKYKGGEKCCCRRTDVLRQFPFPQYSETKFVPEAIVWEIINKRYDQYCVNELYRLYYTDTSDSLSKSGYKLSAQYSAYYAARASINECFDQFLFNKNVRLAFLEICKRAYVTRRGYCRVMKEINAPVKRVMLSAIWPFMWIASKIYYRKRTYI